MCTYIESIAQKIDTKDFVFDWQPNPTNFIKDNFRLYFTNDEVKKINECNALFFETRIAVQQSKIVSICYSKFSSEYNKIDHSRDLDIETARKLSKVLFENIKITEVKSLSRKIIPNDTITFYITIDLK